MTRILLTISLLFSHFALADELLCPVGKGQPWDKMKESDFSQENANAQIDKLKQYFGGDIEVAEEFLYQSLIVLEGSFLRQEIKNWEDQPANREYYKKRFCEFMAEKAYLVH